MLARRLPDLSRPAAAPDGSSDVADRQDAGAGSRELTQRHGGGERDHHAKRRGEVAVARPLGRAELLEAEDEKHGREQVSEGDQGVHFGAGESAGRLAVCLPLNISSIRSVTTKPPTTLVVARVTATSPSTMVTRELAPAAIKIAPTRMMPWIALVPDIRGVWRMVGTLEITSKPTKDR